MTEASACREECERLLRLADALPAPDRTGLPANPGEDPGAWKEWRDAVETLAAAADADADADSHGAMAAERRVEELTTRLRELWLTRAHGGVARYYRSPPLTAEPPRLPSGHRVSFSYERNVPADALERRLARDADVPAGWRADHVTYANGMAALAGVLQTYLGMARPAAGEPLRVGVWGGYFETDVLLQLLAGPGCAPRRLDTRDALCRAVASGDLDVLFVEPVRYDWDLESLDLNGLLTAWYRRPAGRPGVLVVDTTLVATTWPTARLLSALDPRPPDVVVEIRSALKLDQQGLELANAGVAAVFTREPARPHAGELATVLRKMRTITGSGLGLADLAALDAPFALARSWTQEHARAVFLNNALAASVLARRTGTGLFARIAHPTLAAPISSGGTASGGTASGSPNAPGRRPPWAQGPFVVCHLAEDTLAHHGLLLAVVEHEARGRGLCLTRGSSFGFRGHRFETIIPRLSEQRGLFKIAMGSRGGPSRDGAIELFAELAAYPDFAALRAAHPRVVPVDLTDLEP